MVWRSYTYTGHQWNDAIGAMTTRPLLLATLRNGNESLSVSGLVDSGSEPTLVRYDVANDLKINLNPCRDILIGGVGSTKGKICDIVLELPDFKFTKLITAIFVKDLPFSLLLGQRDFFSDFDVRFEKKNDAFFLKKA